MPRTVKRNTKKQKAGYFFSLLYFCVQASLATERWQIVVLPDTNYNTPNELPAFADDHSTISQGLTIALTNADFDVLDLHYLGLPNCIIEDCSTLTDQTIQQAAIRSGKYVNLALLYKLNAFKQRQTAAQKWYFSLSGRLLDLQSGAQQDAFTVDNWLNSPAKNCIGDCLALWLKQNLALLAQDLGMVLSEKLEALPRRFHYQLKLNNFTSAQLQKMDSNVKNIDGYIADILLEDSQNKTPDKIPNQDENRTHRTLNTSRTYRYVSELTASDLGVEVEKLNKQNALSFKFEYDSTQRVFTLIHTKKADPWATLTQFMTDLFPSLQRNTLDTLNTQPPASPEELSTHSELTETTQSQKPEADEEKEAIRDNKMWQQALNINSQDSYQQYLVIWPQGQHFIQAKALIAAFQDDENLWLQASKNKTNQAFQHYLALKPTGKYRNQAKQQLVLLRAQQQKQQKQKQNKALADEFYHQQKNYPEALYYYEQAAKLGDVSSQYLLGKMYADAKGTELNIRQAANWYEKSAKQGHAEAQTTLGYMYSKGNGVVQDYSQAINWYEKAAIQGHISAQYNLAYLYSLGRGVARNYQQAAYWFEKSALQGDDDAQNSLGKLYERGLGVNKNLAKAKNLYKQAADQGNQIAQLNLHMLNN